MIVVDHMGQNPRDPPRSWDRAAVDPHRRGGCDRRVTLRIRAKQPERDAPQLAAFLQRHHSARVARLGELLDPSQHPALVAEDDGRIVGVLTYVPHRTETEILTLHVEGRWRGVGTALIGTLERLAAEAGQRRLFLITTNDNVDALRFYQRRGFRLAQLRPGAVDDSRERLKPEIPRTGNYGIPLRDELVLDKTL
jgi:ribosomal protein S18 acetylase RimI-like enzyme